ncbi:putative cyclin-dependent serine/threonine-protein kinase DDB_G0272797/DDB_G0274007 [Liolophura sinensis]|uniref:putative cyclin-dependent serine/threonine-protein kinase DDB_G0272797/DDB_G0274007 n=1 Tax=Liolophura sinensis TaxID=3198878 RepID=UPI00315920E8
MEQGDGGFFTWGDSWGSSTPLQAPVPYSANFAKTSTSTPQESQAMFSIPKSTNSQQQQQQHYFTDSHYPPFMEDSPTGGAVHHWQHQPHPHVTAEAGEHYEADELYGLPSAVAQREVGHWEHGQMHLQGYSTVKGTSAERHLHGNPVIGQREEAEGGNEQNHGTAGDGNGHWYQHHMPNGYYLNGYDSLQQQQQQQHENDVYTAEASGVDEIQPQQQQHGYYGETVNSGEEFPQILHGYIPSHEQQNYLYSHEVHDQQAYIPSHDNIVEPYPQPQSHDAHEHQSYVPSHPY